MVITGEEIEYKAKSSGKPELFYFIGNSYEVKTLRESSQSELFVLFIFPK